MPRFEVTDVVATRDVSAIRAVCDGCDPARPCDEHARDAWLWTVTSGTFQLRDASGMHALDPTRAIVMPAGHRFVIRHPAGPDTCVAFRGPVVDQLAQRAADGRTNAARLAAISPSLSARIAAELAAFARGEGDELAIAELLAELAEPSEPDEHGGVVEAIAHVVRLDFASSTSLSELAARAGYSLFHACRTFRTATGQTIHGFRRELRLRHALARILDGDEPLSEIAAACGFASQSHLTNLFRARFGVTPARARTRDGLQRLCA